MKLPVARVVTEEDKVAATLRRQKLFAFLLCAMVLSALAATWSR